MFYCEICGIYKNTFFHKTPPMVASMFRHNNDSYFSKPSKTWLYKLLKNNFFFRHFFQNKYVKLINCYLAPSWIHLFFFHPEILFNSLLSKLHIQQQIQLKVGDMNRQGYVKFYLSDVKLEKFFPIT